MVTWHVQGHSAATWQNLGVFRTQVLSQSQMSPCPRRGGGQVAEGKTNSGRKGIAERAGGTYKPVFSALFSHLCPGLSPDAFLPTPA